MNKSSEGVGVDTDRTYWEPIQVGYQDNLPHSHNYCRSWLPSSSFRVSGPDLPCRTGLPSRRRVTRLRIGCGVDSRRPKTTKSTVSLGFSASTLAMVRSSSIEAGADRAVPERGRTRYVILERPRIPAFCPREKKDNSRSWQRARSFLPKGLSCEVEAFKPHEYMLPTSTFHEILLSQLERVYVRALKSSGHLVS